MCGFSGVVAITPRQVTQANVIFSPSSEEIKWAKMIKSKRTFDIYQDFMQRSRDIVGPPTHIKASKILDQVQVIKKYNQKMSA